MKGLLIVSVVLNIILGGILYQEKQRPVVERIIIEEKPAITHKKRKAPEIRPQTTLMHSQEVPVVDDEKLDPVVSFESQEYEDQVSVIENERKDFLISQLGLREEVLEQHNKLREDFLKKTNAIYGKDPVSMGEMSFADKKELIRLEEEYQKKLIELYGKKNWNKFEAYRKRFNENVMKRVQEENAPAILMGI